MGRENPLWGAPRIHGELLMLGFQVAQSTVFKYMMRGQGPPSQSWKTFLQNHAEAIAAVDMCVVPTLTFERLFAFLVLGHGRRQLLWFEMTRRPTAEWLARQITEAFPWASAPTYLVRDNHAEFDIRFGRKLPVKPKYRVNPLRKAVSFEQLKFLATTNLPNHPNRTCNQNYRYQYRPPWEGNRIVDASENFVEFFHQLNPDMPSKQPTKMTMSEQAETLAISRRKPRR